MFNPRQHLLTPRNGHTLVVCIVARISGCAKQTGLSLDDQVAHAKKHVAAMYGGEVEYRVIRTKGKGERRDRPELAELELWIRSRQLDLVFAEDIGRIVRGTAASDLCGLALDHGTRVLAPNDGVDTADANWEEYVISACRDHVGHNVHTSLRIKHKMMNRFLSFGGCFPCLIFGYVKPDNAETFADLLKDGEAEAVFSEWLRILGETLNCTAVADWLNGRGVAVGPYARRSTWNGAMVRRITRNPILKGMPARGTMHTVKHHGTGSRVPVKNPEGPSFQDFPHLAFWSPADFDEINARLAEANKGAGRKPVDGADPRLRVPRKRTRFPGQHAICWYCGRQCVWGGNGMVANLMCNGSRDWRCWNSVGFPGAAIADAVADAVEAELAGLDGLDGQFRELLERAGREGGAGLERELADLARDEGAAQRQKDNLMAAILAYGTRPDFDQKLRECDEGQRELARRRAELEARRGRAPRLPASGAELRSIIAGKFRSLSRDSYEFGDLLRLLAPEVHVYTVRLVDGGPLRSRARVRLDLSGSIPDAGRVSGYSDLTTRLLTVDLFTPPQRVQIRDKAVRLTAEGLDQRQVARELVVSQPAVTAALKLDRLMRERETDTPYLLVAAPPPDHRKRSRQVNGKYRFEPSEGYQPPDL